MTETLIETTRDYTTEIELAGTGSYTITVTAIGDGETYGNSDPAEKTVTIRNRKGENLGTFPFAQAIAMVKERNDNRVND